VVTSHHASRVTRRHMPPSLTPQSCADGACVAPSVSPAGTWAETYGAYSDTVYLYPNGTYADSGNHAGTWTYSAQTAVVSYSISTGFGCNGTLATTGNTITGTCYYSTSMTWKMTRISATATATAASVRGEALGSRAARVLLGNARADAARTPKDGPARK